MIALQIFKSISSRQIAQCDVQAFHGGGGGGGEIGSLITVVFFCIKGVTKCNSPSKATASIRRKFR